MFIQKVDFSGTTSSMRLHFGQLLACLTDKSNINEATGNVFPRPCLQYFPLAICSVKKMMFL